MADGKVKIDVELTKEKFERQLKDIDNSTKSAFTKAGNNTRPLSRSLNDIARESGKTMNQLRSEVMKSAATYQKAGMTKSEAMRKAYADIGYYVDNTGKKLNEGKGHIRQYAASFIKSMGIVYGALGVGKLASAGLKFNAQIESYTANFKVMLGSQEKAVKKVTQLKKMAAKTPFELTDLADATQTLLAFQVPAKKTQKYLQQLGDISLGNKEKLKGLALVFGQVSSAGRLTGQDLLQFINQGFNPLNYIAKRTGESMTELRDRMSKGQIGVEEVAQAFEDATSKGGQFYKGMEEGSKTFEGQLSTLKDNFNELLGKAMKPLFDYLTKKGLPNAISLVSTLSENLNTLAMVAGGLSASFSFLFVTKQLGKAWLFASAGLAAYLNGTKGLTLMSAIVGVLTGKIRIATAATVLWGKAMLFLSANKFVIIAAAIIGVATALGIAAHQAGGFTELFNKVGDVIGNIIKKLPEFASAFVDFITMAVKVIGDNAPQIFDALIRGLSEGLPKLAQSAVDIIMSLIESINSNLPLIIDSAVTIIEALAQGFVENAPAIVDAAVNLITALLDGILANLPLVMGATIQIMMALVNGLIQAIPILVQYAPQIINGLINAIIIALPLLIKAGFQIIKALGGALIQSLPILIKSAPRIIMAIIKGLLTAIGQIVRMGAKIITSIIKGIGSALGRLPAYGRKIVSNVIQGAKNGISGMLAVGRNLIEGVWNGISSKVTWVKSKIKNAFDSIKDLVKKIFSIKSPSRWMRDVIGKNIMLGWAEGITGNIKVASNAMKKAGNKIKTTASGITAGSIGIGAGAGINGGGVNIVDNRQVTQNFYNKNVTKFDAYRRSEKGFGKGYSFAY